MTIAKIIILCVAAFLSFSVVYHAPRIPAFLKPLLPIEKRWTVEELAEQIRAKRVDEDYVRYFMRDPERSLPSEKRILVAPADGTIKVVKSLDGRRRVVIYLSFWDVHIQRVPVSGIVTGIADSRHEDGGDFKCEECPQKTTDIEADAGRITVKQVTSGFTTRLRMYLSKGQAVDIGQRLGAILLGSHVVIEFPEQLTVAVKVGDKVYGGETIIARY